jgi:hypothetical protein
VPPEHKVGGSNPSGRAIFSVRFIFSKAADIRDFSAPLTNPGYVRVAMRSCLYGGIGLHWAIKK